MTTTSTAALTTQPVILPRVLSQLIRLAVGDLEKAENDDNYKIDMGQWHAPNSHCSVCFAGAVMAFSLGADCTQHCNPYYFTGNEDQLQALDAVRKGMVAYAHIRVSKLDWETDRHAVEIQSLFYSAVPCYRDDPALFKSTMRMIADKLEEKGL